MYIMEALMKFAKWGNSVAIRIPAEVVARLGISPNDEAQIKVTGKYTLRWPCAIAYARKRLKRSASWPARSLGTSSIAKRIR